MELVKTAFSYAVRGTYHCRNGHEHDTANDVIKCHQAADDKQKQQHQQELEKIDIKRKEQQNEDNRLTLEKKQMEIENAKIEREKKQYDLKHEQKMEELYIERMKVENEAKRHLANERELEMKRIEMENAKMEKDKENELKMEELRIDRRKQKNQVNSDDMYEEAAMGKTVLSYFVGSPDKSSENGNQKTDNRKERQDKLDHEQEMKRMEYAKIAKDQEHERKMEELQIE